MLKVGLTGSIAVGKSYVVEILRELGCHVLDADQTAREVVKPGTDGLAEIVENFGSGVLTSVGTLDRGKMASLVFADPEKLSLLNSIVHPRVIAVQDAWIRQLAQEDPDGIAVIDAALMIESGGHSRFDELIVVWCKADIQLKRLMLRDSLSEVEARKRIAAQMPQEEKKKFADHLIDTSDGRQSTRSQVEKVVGELRSRET